MEPRFFLDGLDAHQCEAVPWLLDRRAALLAWEMGVGKTAPLLRAWENTAELGPALVLCLNSAKENWARESANFACDKYWPPRVQVIRNGKTPIDPAASIVICNYEKLLIKDVLNRLRGARRWGVLICDEAHRLKTLGSKTTQAVYALEKSRAGRYVPLIANAERVWLATGTPMPNHPGELYPHMAALWPDRLQYQGHTMEEWEFQAAFCQIKQTKYGPSIVGGRNLDELRERLAPVMSRLTRADVLTLPPCRIVAWPLTTEDIPGPIPDLTGLLGSLAERYGTPDKIESFDGVTLDAYLSCLQSAISPLATLRRETAQLKAVCVGLMVKEELECGAPKTVLFAHHTEAIRTLVKILAPFKPATISGAVPEANRQNEVDRFQTDPECKVFVGQIQAAGSSLNLQAGKNVVFVEASWTPGENDQALSRVYRKGQTDPVLVRFTYLGGSVDEAVNRALARKATTISRVLDNTAKGNANAC